MIHNFNQFINESFYYQKDGEIERLFISYYDFFLNLKIIIQDGNDYKIDYYQNNIMECYQKFSEFAGYKFSKKDAEVFSFEYEKLERRIDKKVFKETKLSDLLELCDFISQSEDDKRSIKKILDNFRIELSDTLDDIVDHTKKKIKESEKWEIVDGLENVRSDIESDAFKREKYNLQIEFLKVQEWVKKTGRKVLVIFDGRDAAGKGGCISRITESLNPKTARVESFSIPTPEESADWFRRYINKLPERGEIVFFDRSWYTRAYVEAPMDYCTPEQYDEFMEMVLPFEDKIQENGIDLIKVWLSVDQDTQKYRFELRKSNPLKYWKFSENDAKILNRWGDFTTYIDQMLKRCNKRSNPWIIVDANDERRCEIEAMKAVLNRMEYDHRSTRYLKNPTAFMNESVISDSDVPYVFLDIDGVLIPYDPSKDVDYHKFFDEDRKWSKTAIEEIEALVNLYSARLVLISSYIRTKTMDVIKDRLKAEGFGGEIYDELPNVYGEKNRFENVLKYVKDNRIKTYVVIDDHKHDLKKAAGMKSHWVNVKSEEGLRKKDVRKIEKILNKKSHH